MSHAEEESAARIDERGRKRKERRIWEQRMAFVFIVALGLWGFHVQEKQNEHDAAQDVKRCEDGAIIREVLRSQVLALYDLGMAATQGQPTDANGNPRPRTPAEQQQLDQYIKNLTRYRDTQLAKIQPSAACPIPTKPPATPPSPSPTRQGEKKQ